MGWTPLMLATQTGNHHTMVYLLKKGASTCITDSNGLSALMLACLFAHVDCTALLIDFNADVNAVNKKGWSAVFYAAAAGHADVVHLLLRKQCLFDITDLKGVSPLMLAAVNGHAKIVDALLHYGANLFITSKANETALSLAIENNHVDVIATIQNHIILRQTYFHLMEMVPGISYYKSVMKTILAKLGITMYYSIFQVYEIDNIDAFCALTDADLLRMGIHSLGHRRKLKMEIAKWQELLKMRDQYRKQFANKIMNLNQELRRRFIEFKEK